MDIKIVALNFSFDKKLVLQDIHLEIKDKEIFVLLGPNGSGKTTLLHALSRIFPISQKTIYLGMKDLAKMNRKEIAQSIGVMEQEIPLGFDFTVREIVQLGRIPHQKPWQRMGPKDEESIQKAMVLSRIEKLSQRSIFSLSSGERQRVWLALALAQTPQILLLDEPTSHLDIHYQIEILEMIQHLSQQGITVVMSMHDINLASQYAHRIALLKEGRIVKVGTPREILTRELMEKVYEVSMDIVEIPNHGIFVGIPVKPKVFHET